MGAFHYLPIGGVDIANGRRAFSRVWRDLLRTAAVAFLTLPHDCTFRTATATTILVVTFHYLSLPT